VTSPETGGDVRRVAIYDTTLRDGSQGEGVSYTVTDKLRIAERLDAFGVAFIEGGWPGSNPKDAEFFERAREREWKHATLAAFGSTRRANKLAEEDANLLALIASRAPVCTIFGKTWNMHVTDVLRTTLQKNLEMIEESVAFLVHHDRRVIYDAEHFFDGYRADPEYALATLEAARRGGAETLVLCDTNGGSLPWEVEEIVKRVFAKQAHPLGIHAHDDTGCGVANSLAAVRGGATQIQGTMNGVGKRQLERDHPEPRAQTRPNGVAIGAPARGERGFEVRCGSCEFVATQGYGLCRGVRFCSQRWCARSGDASARGRLSARRSRARRQ